MSLKFAVGDLTIHRIIEQETTFLPALEMLPGLTPELLAENRRMDAEGRRARCQRRADPVLPVLCGEDAASHHPDRQLHRQRQAAAAAAEMEHEDRRHLRARAGCRRDFRRRYRLCHVHASACRSCRLEHAARQRPLGADLPQGALRVRQDRVRLLDRNPREDAGAAVCRQRAAGRRGQAGRDRARRLRDRRPRAHPADAGPHARPCRLHLRPRQGRCGVFRRPDAFAAADALSGTIRQVRCRSAAGGGNAARLPGALLRHRYAVLHRAFPLPVHRKDSPCRQWILLRGDYEHARGNT